MHYFDAVLSLLSNRPDFQTRIFEAIQAAMAAGSKTPEVAYTRALRALVGPFEQPCLDLLLAALQKLQERAGEKGRPELADGLELRASADLIDMDWGKSELAGDRLTLRLVATHCQMPRDPVVVEKVLQVTV